MSAAEHGTETDTSLSPVKRALLAVERLQARLQASEQRLREPVAIIGVGCRIPGGGDDPASFWRLLRDGVDATGPVPTGRWDMDALYDPDPGTPGRIAARRGGFLTQIDRFDSAFFGIARREAEGMDPQQRLLLQVSWEALEHAGQAPDRLARSATGVYVGVCTNDYAQLQLHTGDRSLLDAHFASGMAHSIVSGRLSYLLGLQGPSLSIDTACSSSLVAVHLACQALRVGDCRMALAGGVNLILSPDLYIALSHSRMLAPDGRCKTFDAAADGFARGEGCGVIVLKLLRDAQQDGDRVLAVIRGSAVNQDGASSGLTAPNGPSQEAVIREALARAGIEPRQVGYVEAHGTGTQLGDPLEAHALGAVFSRDRDPARPLLIGSVKTNVGHLEAAAGVTGLIKLVLALRARTIPAHLHFRRPSPHIAWSDMPLEVPTAPRIWEPIEGRRIAGVSSFGFSGTNAHIVVEEAPERTARRSVTAPAVHLFVLSAKDAPALAEAAGRCAEALQQRSDAELADVCFTAAVGRAQFPHRAAIFARSMRELCDGLRVLAAGGDGEHVRVAQVTRRDPARIAFLFTGQGAQYAGMAQALYAEEPVFRDALDRCALVLDELLERPLREVIFAGSGALLDETVYTQPALFAVEYALAQLWSAWGIRPSVVIGHSVGEIVAACIAGVLPLHDALRLIAVRGRLMQSLPAGGAMAAIVAGEADVAAALTGRADVSIAALNAPQQTVISGAAAAVDELCATFARRGVRCQRLAVSHAFHSPLLDPMLDELEREAATLRFARPQLRVISNLTGRLAEPDELTRPAYWRRHAREPVRFADGLRALATLRPDICVEIGPHPTLLSFFAATAEGSVPALLPTLRKGRSDREQLDETLAGLFLAGADLDWRAVWRGRGAELTELPSYPFGRERCWFRARGKPELAPGRPTGHPLLGVRLRSAAREVMQFETVLRSEDLPYLRDHNVRGRTILPATGFIEMALAASRLTLGKSCELHDVLIVEPLTFVEDETRIVQVLIRRDSEGAGARFQIYSSVCDETCETWSLHAEGGLRDGAAANAVVDDAHALARCTEKVDAAEHYALLQRRGLAFGPSLRGVQVIRRRDGEAIGEIEFASEQLAGSDAYLFHPALLDACLQVLSAALPRAAAEEAYLPFAIESVQVYRTPGRALRSHVRLASTSLGSSATLAGEVRVSDEFGPLAQLTGLVLRAPSADAGAELPLYEIAWEPATLCGTDAGWLPEPAVLAAEAGASLEILAREHGLAVYHEAYVALEELSMIYVCAALRSLGWQPATGERVERDELADRLGIVPRYRRLLGRLLAMLAEDGVLRVQSESGAPHWVVATPPTDADPGARLQELLQQYPSSQPRLRLVGNCGSALADMLRGIADPLQQLFPDGSTELAEALYRDSPEAKVYNQLLARTVRAAVERLPPGRRIRVLEVGGGTGGTTAWVVPLLPADRTDYLFTDVGPLLVARARERFAAHAFIEYRSFDLEQDAAAQGIVGPFDLILAANVVHATADIVGSLRRLSGLLAPGGAMLLLEVAGLERWIDITFGLTEGWWRFTDTDLRPDYPLLTRERWLEVLTGLGMDATPVGQAHAWSRQALLLARKPLQSAMEPAPGRWLILADEGGVGQALAGSLRAAGHEVDELHCLTDRAAGGRELRRWIEQAGNELRGIVHLWSLDIAAPDERRPEALVERQQASLESVLTIVHAVGSLSYAAGETPRLYLVTRGAQPVQGPAPLSIAQSPIWGLSKTLALEHPELRTMRIDLDPEATVQSQASALLEHLGVWHGEDQIAVRARTTYLARLQHAQLPPSPPAEPAVRLESSASGVLDDLALQPVTRRPVGAGEVEIRVYAAGLNFRDVMNAVAMREDPEPLGGECAGRIVAIGPGVSGLAVGDDVVAIAVGCFGTFVTTSARNVVPLPEFVSHVEAATLPFAFMTADHALRELARLRAGETLLIHAAAGGVGMAALQLARSVGARVIATAGSERKRTYLHALGVEHVLDSRSLEFSDQVLALTNGRGVDVVLNSLAGEFIAASVRCLAEQGRFLEIGKRDIWSDEQFRRVRPNGEYHSIDLAAQRIEDPESSWRLFASIMQRVRQGELHPLPVQVFSLSRATEAFRFMAQARHIGKIVLTQEDCERAALDRLRSDASYLVTGGLTGLGLLTAERLVQRGARHLLLVGRRAPGEVAAAAIARMQALGANVLTAQADVACPAEVARVLELMDRQLPPLRGVVHSAGLLQDAALLQQDWRHFAAPLGPKVDGTWALHALTQRQPLDFFVMYSSMASMVGSAGQANHAAANAFMDALAAHRRARGLPALSVSWGPWSEIGAAADRKLEAQVGAEGMEAIEPQRGLEVLERLLRGGKLHAGVFPVRWEVFLERRDRRHKTRFFEKMRRRQQASTAGWRADALPQRSRPGVLESLHGATPGRRRELLLGFVAAQAARVLSAPDPEAIDTSQPLSELGLDSLMAVELRNRLASGLQLSRGLPATLVFDHPTLEALAHYLEEQLQLTDPQVVGADQGADPGDVVDAIGEMSDEQIEALFARKMRGA